MSVLDSIKEKAKADVKHILLPEGSEERTVQAARIITDEKIAKVTLLGDEEEIKKVAEKFNVCLCGIDIINPLTDPDFEHYANGFYELRKAKGMTPEKARETIKNTLFYACMMIKEGKADGMVSGAINTTGNTLRPGLQIIKMAKGINTISSCFIMEIPNKEYGDNGLMLFGDCAININPNPDELASIAIATANTAKTLLGMDPKVAMLSFSTKGSAKHENVDKVTAALAKVKELAPDWMLTANFRRMPPWFPRLPRSRLPAARLPAMPTCLYSPICRRATSAISWCSVLPVPRL